MSKNPTPELAARFPIGSRVRLTAEGQRVLGNPAKSTGTVTGYGSGFGLLRVRREGNKRPETNHSGCWEPDAAVYVPYAPPQPEERLALAVNGHQLAGECRGGAWSFSCPDWPDVAEQHNGSSTSADAIRDFMARALGGALRVRVLVHEWEGGGT